MSNKPNHPKPTNPVALTHNRIVDIMENNLREFELSSRLRLAISTCMKDYANAVLDDFVAAINTSKETVL